MRKIRFRYFFISIILILHGCSDDKKWYRGNTHTHTAFSNPAFSSPHIAAKWYQEHGYNFLVLSEHNRFVEIEAYKFPEYLQNEFIFIPGQEVTGFKTVHTTAMNINRYVPSNFDHINKSVILQNHVSGIVEAGGQAILNHPNYRYAVTAENILSVKNLHMFELFNGHPVMNNFGDNEHSSTEEIWDQLLTKGMLIYAVASDDARQFETFADNMSNPGRGWVMVHSPKLDADEIVKAMMKGNFYSSSGVFLKTNDRHPNAYIIEVDEKKTEEELSQDYIKGNRIEKRTEGYKIEFIGSNGEILKAIETTKGNYKIKKSDVYVRAKVTYTRMHQDGGYEEFYAWGQPIIK
jgi:predicted metal-dependent phosphoesterase TrpH